MAQHITNREGKVLLRHPKTENTAWFSPRTVDHHRKAGWVYATSKDDQPAPAGDTGTPAGGSDNPKGKNA